jgi:hypothetical protein
MGAENHPTRRASNATAACSFNGLSFIEDYPPCYPDPGWFSKSGSVRVIATIGVVKRDVKSNGDAHHSEVYRSQDKL